jgi:hypothetical protein
MRPNRNATRVLGILSLVVLARGLAGCSPTLDWREVRAPGTPAVALMPCTPAAQQRQLSLAGARTTVTLQACSAGGVTWALVSADVVDPTRIGPALGELLAASARNVSVVAPVGTAFGPPGSTPNVRSRRARMVGTLPDGKPAQLESAVFTHGTWVFQATVLGEKVDERADREATDNFFSSLRIAS